MSEPAGGPVTDFVDDLYHRLGHDEAAVEAALRSAFKKYFEPIDLPYVPNLVVEPMVDGTLENWFVKGIQEGHKRIHTED
jgi:hypothetical protein